MRFTGDGKTRPIQVRPRCDARSSFEPPINANGRKLKARSWASFAFMSVHSRFLPTRTAGYSRPVSRPYSLTANCALTPKRLLRSIRKVEKRSASPYPRLFRAGPTLFPAPPTTASPDIGLSKPRAIRPAHVEEWSSIRTSESHHRRDRFRTQGTWRRAVRTRYTHIADIAGLRRYSIDAQDPRKRSLCQQQSARARRESSRGRTISANAHVLCCATRTNQRAFLRGSGRRCCVAPASAAHLQPPMR